MTPDEAARARLVAVARTPPGTAPAGPSQPDAGPALSGEHVPRAWVPDAPADPQPVGEPPVDGPAIRDRALASAVAAYTAAYGHPLESEALDDRPDTHRWATPARVTGAAVAVLLALGGMVIVRAAQQVPGAVIALDPPAVESEAEPGEPLPPAASTVVVHVAGQVAQPGVVTLPSGSRVVDAIEAVGGAGTEADLTAVNLARVVVDGEQILVPRPGEARPDQGGGTDAGGTVDLNSADVALLDTLPGIGPVLAQRIVDWRADHGRFTSVDELTEVSGIGPALLGDVRDLVSVG